MRKQSQISIRLPKLALERLKIEARADGISVGAAIRRRLEGADLGAKLDDLGDRLSMLQIEIQRGRM
jgi:hypothetical protein